jgi:hypothetical protein
MHGGDEATDERLVPEPLQGGATLARRPHVRAGDERHEHEQPHEVAAAEHEGVEQAEDGVGGGRRDSLAARPEVASPGVEESWEPPVPGRSRHHVEHSRISAVRQDKKNTRRALPSLRSS